MMRVVVDTNVLVSALLSHSSKPARILDLIISGKITLLLDDRILSEYRDVLRQPKFAFDEDSVDDLCAFLESIAEFILAAPLAIKIPDAADLMFLEVAHAGEADALITGNKKDYGRSAKNPPILSPDEFLNQLSVQP